MEYFAFGKNSMVSTERIQKRFFGYLFVKILFARELLYDWSLKQNPCVMVVVLGV